MTPTKKEVFIDALRGVSGKKPLFVPDLTLWYGWHAERNTLPAGWEGRSIVEAARAMDVPVWQTVTPWQREWALPVVEERAETTRRMEYRTEGGTLTSGWSRGPDGDWWQTEYPIKSEDDLSLLSQIIPTLSYKVEGANTAGSLASVGDDGVLAVELPMRPYSFLLHHFLGWTDGLMLAMMNGDLISELCSVLEAKLRDLVARLVELPVSVFLCPDNLDASFLSPTVFESEMAESYTATSAVIHEHGKVVVVHAGGMIRPLLEPLAGTGIDCIEGISGPPQSDATLGEAHELTGGKVTLWGGIPQDALLPAFEHDEFVHAVKDAQIDAERTPRCLLGVADRVPVDAEVARLRWINNTYGA